MFKLKALDNEELEGHYYAHELSRVRGDTLYRIESILQNRGNKRLVKYQGIKKPEWTHKRNIENLS